MSDYPLYTLNFATRRDMPPAMQAILTALSAGERPAEADLATLPEVVSMYLGRPAAPAHFSAGLMNLRFSRLEIDWRDEAPGDATHLLHLEQRFHDDEYASAGVYFINWMFQFAAGNGHLATEISESSPLPTIYTRQGREILVTSLNFPQSGANPVTVGETYRYEIASAVQGAIDWTDDWG
ncbi:MAG: hypothetical protein DI616_14330 [Paracoccus denitrificans]|uniref:Uncharacterized protein n=1 Tax=Paracoccus denitrificans TaxID=266 RepID=A0A533I4F5_PARDE|nr:MAG: hypothetical protein DI616_14330 [Paracoccus denitrificans]